MAWVQRDAASVISGVFANKQVGYAEEELPDTDPAVVAFLNPPARDLVDSWDLVSLRIAFSHENRLRALEGKAAVTLAQFKSAVRSQL